MKQYYEIKKEVTLKIQNLQFNGYKYNLFLSSNENK